MQKKFFALVLAGVMALSALTACGGDKIQLMKQPLLLAMQQP